jgi:D-beta-D-heptose 7-phosphate kinase/D-beta-D-heptose 1-phosphate adenosyltransferase
MNLAGLGTQVFLAGFWGADGEREELKKLVEAAGVDTAGVVTSSLPTISKTRIVARTQQMLRLDIESRESVPAEEMAWLEARAVELVKKVHVVILSDYAKGALTAGVCEAVIRAARKSGIPVLVDPKTRDLSKYSGATTICPNLAELSLATGVPAHQTEALLKAAHAQMVEHDFRFLTVTMSEKGIRILGPASDGSDDCDAGGFAGGRAAHPCGGGAGKSGGGHCCREDRDRANSAA